VEVTHDTQTAPPRCAACANPALCEDKGKCLKAQIRPEYQRPSKELLPCPFCGSGVEVRLIPAHEHRIVKWMPPAVDTWVVECTGCDARFCADSREAVVAAWNRRQTVKPSDGSTTAVVETVRRLEQENERLRIALRRLVFAGLCRDNTEGDPIRLIEVRTELREAVFHGYEVLATLTTWSTPSTCLVSGCEESAIPGGSFCEKHHTPSAEEDLGRALYERNAKGWRTALKWEELRPETRDFWRKAAQELKFGK